MASRDLTEARLEAALQRLIDGNPQRVKKTGKLSLNKINNEAGLGHSYIHKFERFIEEVANPAIKKFNDDYDPSSYGIKKNEEDLTELEKLKLKLKKEKELKVRYRQQRDEAIASKKQLEMLNSSLMFRLFELQEEVRSYSVVSISTKKE